MTRCPHCGKISNPLRFLFYTHWSPYRCVSCKKKSRFRQGGMALVGGVFVFSASMARGILLPHLPFWIMVPILLTTFLVVMWVFLRLHPLEGESIQRATDNDVAAPRRV